MNATQSARFKAYTLALAHIKENEGITKGVPAIEVMYLSAKTTLDAIANADLRKIEKLKGVAGSKQQYQDNLANQALAIASVIGTYAATKKDLALKEAMNFSRTELFFGADQLLSGKCTIILAKARELAGELPDYGITGLLIDNFAGMLENYAAIMNEPRNVSAERKQAGMLVNELFKQLQMIFTDKLDAMMLLFKFTHSDFYDQYLIKRMIVNPGQRKTRVEGIVTDKTTHQALDDVTVMVKGTDMITTTPADGSYSLKTPLLKRVPVVYQKKGYKSVTLETTVKKGKATTVNVELEFE